MIPSNKNWDGRKIARLQAADQAGEEVDQLQEKEIMKDRDQEEIMKGIEGEMKEIIGEIEGDIIGIMIVKVINIEVVIEEEVDHGHLQGALIEMILKGETIQGSD